MGAVIASLVGSFTGAWLAVLAVYWYEKRQNRKAMRTVLEAIQADIEAVVQQQEEKKTGSVVH